MRVRWDAAENSDESERELKKVKRLCLKFASQNVKDEQSRRTRSNESYSKEALRFRNYHTSKCSMRARQVKTPLAIKTKTKGRSYAHRRHAKVGHRD
jgi:hypothetical protein